MREDIKSKLKLYVIINDKNKYYKYHIFSSQFTSDINNATLRTYADSYDLLKEFNLSIQYHKRNRLYSLRIENIRKIKLQKINETTLHFQE